MAIGVRSLSTPAPQARAAPAKLLVSGLIVLAVLFASIWYFWGVQNSDWLSYRAIFQTGSYLELQGRDPAYLALNTFFQGHVTYDYDVFRVWLAVYFVIFTACWLWVTHRVAEQNATFGLTFVGILPLMIPLVTVQIREGVGVTIALTGLWLLRRGAIPVALGVGLLVLASFVHLALTIFIALAAVGLVVLVTAKAGLPRRPVIVFAGVMTAGVMASLYAMGLLQEQLTRLSEITGYRGVVEVPLIKWAYWLAMGAIVFYIARRVRTAVGNSHTLYSAFQEVTAYIALPILWAAIILFVLVSAEDAALAATAIRLFQLLLFTLIATLTLSVRASATWMLVVGFLVFDDYRTLFAALPT
jgi:hypothetical protein